MSGSIVSSFPSMNALLAPQELAVRQQQAQDYHINALLQQDQHRQEVQARDMEMVSRASAYLETLPEDQRAAAYPTVVRGLQAYGYGMRAPAEYPGHQVISQLARMGTPSEKLFQLQGAAAAADAYGQSTGITGARGGATGGGTPAVPAAPGSYESAIGGHEGTGQNPRSTAYGTGQFLESTWLNFAAEHPEMFPNMSQQQILAARSNPALGNTAINWLAQKNAADLQAAGVTPSGQSLGISHYLGSGAAAKIMQAGDAEPVRKFVSEAAVRANPELANMTVGQMKARYAGTPNPSFMTATTTTPGGQRVQVASVTPATTTDATPAPPGATPAAPAQPAATTTAQGATAAQQPPAAATAGLPVLDENFLSARDREQLRPLLEQARRGVIPLKQVQDEAQQRAQFNVQRQQAAEARQRAEEELGFKRAGEVRAQSEEIRRQDRAKLEAMFQGATPGMMWNADHTSLVPIPGYTGATDKERIKYNLDHGDPNSADYAADYAAMKWQMSQAGNVVENDMSMYRPPAQPIQRPTYLPQPSPQALEDVRKVVVDSQLNVQNIDHYLDVLKRTDGATINTFFNNPRDPKAQALLGAFTALKMTMRGPSAMNTGVLQPHEQVMLKDDLVSPDTVRALGATVPAIEARLHEIKLSLLRKADLENRSVGKEGVIVRNEDEFAKLAPGTVFYDEDGNQRIKRKAQ